MLDRSRFTCHDYKVMDGHRFIKKIEPIPFEDIYLIVFNDRTVETATIDDIIFLYNDAVDSIGHYIRRYLDTKEDAEMYMTAYEELTDNLYG